MEAVPRLPMIHFELKISDEKPNFQQKLKEYIQEHYNEDPETYNNQINQFEGLRAAASRPPKDVTGCATLKRYYCQLHFLTSRFPMNKNGEAVIKFSWKDPYNEAEVYGFDVHLELAAVLFNIGALHTQLGASDNRSTSDGMKMACTHFQCAAWAFQHIPEEYPDISNNFVSNDLLAFMNILSLAQAQECILEKSMMDNRKATIIAKVAVQTVEYYKQSLKKLTQNSTNEYSIVDVIGSKLRKKWEMYVKFKISYHGCIGLLYQGQQSEELQKMGERVAYYQAAIEKLEEARKLSKGLGNIDAVNEALQFTQDVVEGKRKAAKNENEFIYHEEVANVAALPEMKGASLVKGIGFSVNDMDVSGPDIFGSLIPIKAHETSSVYSEELAKLMRKILPEVMEANEALDSFLLKLQLDALKPQDSWELPEEIIDRCAAISTKPDAIEVLQTVMSSLSHTYEEVENMLREINTILDKEDEDVRGYEGVVGKRPPSIVATDLTREAKKYQDAHNKASESNQTLHKAMQLHTANLKLLFIPIRELQSKFPTVNIASPEEQAAIKKMETLMNKVKEMKDQREMLFEQLRQAISTDDITHKVVTFTGESKEDLFQQEIAKHQKQINLIHQNLAAQSKIITAIEEAYVHYGIARRNLITQVQRRDAMASSLISSYDAYEDLITKSNKGLEFYNKLHGNVSKLLQRVKSTCKVQEEEREQVLASILEDVPRNSQLDYKPKPGKKTSLESARVYNDLSATSGGLKLKDYLNMKKETGKLSLVSAETGNYVYDPTWVPGIRPAPVGSDQIETNSQKLSDNDGSYYVNKNNPYYSQQPTPTQNYPSSGNYGMQNVYSANMPSYNPPSTLAYQQQPTVSSTPSYPQNTYEYYDQSSYNYNTVPPYSTESTNQNASYGTVDYSAPNVSQTYSQSTAVSQYNYTSNVANQTYPSSVAQNYSGYPTYPSNDMTCQQPPINYPSYSYSTEQNTYSATNYQYPVDTQYQKNWNYIPAEYGGNNQGTNYQQSPDAGVYTQTQQSQLYTPTSSETYQETPKAYNIEQPNTVDYGYSDMQFVQHPNGNYATQSPVTYKQSDFNNLSGSTTTTHSSSNSMLSPSVQKSNVDLLADIAFDVTQSPLEPQATVRSVPMKTVEQKPEPVIKKEVVEIIQEPEIKKEVFDKQMDVDALRAFAPEVEKFEKFVEGLTVKTLNGPTTLEIKWKEITDSQENDIQNRRISVARCYPLKNRFPDILPFDDTRVELASTKDEYINASLLKKMNPTMPPLILTQAPLTTTYEDFWTMVLEQQVEVIICLLGDNELNTDGLIYWPVDKVRHLTFGKFKISLESCNVKTHWIERILSVTNDGKTSRIVAHLQYISWPGSSFPASPASFISFVQEAKSFLQQQRSANHPAVVHCWSGVGRTGFFVLLLAATIDILAGNGIPDLVTLTLRISQARKNSLRDREHLKFAYQSILYFCQDLLLKNGILTNGASFEDKKRHSRHPSQDFLVSSDSEQLSSKLESLSLDFKGNENTEKSSSKTETNDNPDNSSNIPLLAAMDPSAFSISLQDLKPGRAKQKFKPENFSNPSSGLSGDPSSSADDPLSSLDPLWTLKK